MNGTAKSALIVLISALTPFIWRQSLSLDATPRSDSDADSLETIVVTAEKREERLQEVPMSVTALSGGLLDKLQARDFSDFAVMVPGLSLMSTGPGITQLTLRGQNAGGDGSTVAVYIDESPFGSSNALLNGSVLSGDFDTWDLQRIEVLRGPQGTLYGANSEGGLLKFVTQAPILGNFSGEVEATGESVDHGGNGGDVRAVVNLPLGNIAALRISAFDQDMAGYIDDPLSGQRDVNSGHKDGGRASLLLAPTDTFSIRLTATEQETKTSGNPAYDGNPNTLQPLHGDLTQERYITEPNNFKYENYNATINWNPGPVSVVSTTTYSVLNTDQITDDTNVVFVPPSTTLGEVLTGAFGTPTGGYENNNASMEKVTQEIRLASPVSDFLEWQIGGYYTRETGLLEQHLNALTLPSGAPAALPSLEVVSLPSTYKEWAGFGDVTYHFNSQFDVQLGGRWSTNEQTATESISGLLVGATSFSVPSKGNVFTYSVAPRWHVDANTMVYARLATGFRPGGPNVLPPVAPPSVPRAYGSDSTVNTELGIRSTQLDGHLSIDVAVFHVDWKDIQLLELVDTFNVNGNGGKARSQGVEWTFAYLPVHGLTFTWTGAYTDAELTTPAPAVNGQSGDPLPFAPKFSTSLDGEYEWAAFADYNGFTGVTWSYIGTRSTDFASSNAVVPVQVGLPSYDTVAVRAGLENSRYRVELYGKNLSDARGITGYASSGAPGLGAQINVIQPRTVGVTVSAKF
jgi:iron complex outermembrane receptor protein